MPYRLTEAAADDLENIYFEGLLGFGFESADRYHAGLFKTFAFLAEYPRAARVRDELSQPVRAFKYRSHVIIYLLSEEGMVTIVRVRHGREDWIGDRVKRAL